MSVLRKALSREQFHIIFGLLQEPNVVTLWASKNLLEKTSVSPLQTEGLQFDFL